MQPTVFHYERSKDRPTDLGLVACSVLLGLISVWHLHSDYSRGGSISWPYLLGSIWFSGFAILWLLKIAGIGFLARRWTRISLTLDDEGLRYDPGGLMSPRRWPWTELSEIEYEGPGLLRRPSILFRPETPGLVHRMTMEITASGRRMRLRDIFDAAPREIAAKLNEYRDRALAKPGAGGSQSTPAGRDRP